MFLLISAHCCDGLTELRVLHSSGMAEFKPALKQSHLGVDQTYLLIEPATVLYVTSLVCEVTRCVSSGHYSFERSSRSFRGLPSPPRARERSRGAQPLCVLRAIYILPYIRLHQTHQNSTFWLAG